MTLYFEPWQLVVVCLLTIVGAAVVALVLVGLLGAWLFRDRGSVPVALADDDEADGFREDCAYCRSLRAGWDAGVNVESHANYHLRLEGWEFSPSTTVVSQTDPRHNPLTCVECLGRDRGSF